MYNGKLLLNAIKKEFSFLCSDLGANIVSEEIHQYGVFLTYITKYAGLRISYEPRDGGAFIMIFPMKEKSIPDYVDWYDIIDLFHVNNIDFIEPSVSDYFNPCNKEIENLYGCYAKAIKNSVRVLNFLRGNYGDIGRIKKIVSNRDKK